MFKFSDALFKEFSVCVFLQDKKLRDKLTKAQHAFRKFFLTLIANDREKQKYFQNSYPEEFGDDFKRRLRVLIKTFTGKIDATLPVTEIDQVSLEKCSGLLRQVSFLKIKLATEEQLSSPYCNSVFTYNKAVTLNAKLKMLYFSTFTLCTF